MISGKVVRIGWHCFCRGALTGPSGNMACCAPLAHCTCCTHMGQSARFEVIMEESRLRFGFWSKRQKLFGHVSRRCRDTFLCSLRLVLSKSDKTTFLGSRDPRKQPERNPGVPFWQLRCQFCPETGLFSALTRKSCQKPAQKVVRKVTSYGPPFTRVLARKWTVMDTF